jgi:hypothetical protein
MIIKELFLLVLPFGGGGGTVLFFSKQYNITINLDSYHRHHNYHQHDHRRRVISVAVAPLGFILHG